MFTDLIKHLWRSLAAITTQRNVVHDADTEETSEEITRPILVPVRVPTVVPDISLIIDKDGWLVGKNVVRVPVTRDLYPWKSKSKQPLGLLWHWTATAHGTALGMAKRTRTKEQSSSFVHLWIEHDGTIYQSAPFHGGSGHAGGSTAKHVIEGPPGIITLVSNDSAEYSVNYFLIGIEIVNVGEVRFVAPGDDGEYQPAAMTHPKGVWMGWPFGRRDKKTNKITKGPIVKAADVASYGKRYYHKYTTEQCDAAMRIVRACRREYNFSDRAMSWGHVDVDPGRKTDPGPLWSMQDLPLILRTSR